MTGGQINAVRRVEMLKSISQCWQAECCADESIFAHEVETDGDTATTGRWVDGSSTCREITALPCTSRCILVYSLHTIQDSFPAVQRGDADLTATL